MNIKAIGATIAIGVGAFAALGGHFSGAALCWLVGIYWEIKCLRDDMNKLLSNSNLIE